MNKLQRLLQSKVLILTICAAGIGGTFQYGYNISIINAPTSYIQTFMNETWLEHTGVPLESNMILLLWSFTVSAYPLGGLTGAVVAGPIAIVLGRKMSLLLNNVFVIIAAVLPGFSRASKSFEIIMLRRFFYWREYRYKHEHSAHVSGGKCSKEAQRSCGLDFCIIYSPGVGAGAGCWTQMYFYAAHVFQEAGIAQDKIPYVNVITDYSGRRPLLLGGYFFMAGWAIVFMVALSQQTQISWMPYLSMACVFTDILSFGIGPAGVTGVLPTEAFDQMSRPAAYMICGSLLWFNLFLVVTAFPFIVKSLAHFCYIPFLVVSVCAALYVGFFLPETKGKSFWEISEEFKKQNFKAQTHAVFL